MGLPHHFRFALSCKIARGNNGTFRNLRSSSESHPMRGRFRDACSSCLRQRSGFRKLPLRPLSSPWYIRSTKARLHRQPVSCSILTLVSTLREAASPPHRLQVESSRALRFPGRCRVSRARNMCTTKVNAAPSTSPPLHPILPRALTFQLDTCTCTCTPVYHSVLN